MGVNTAYNGALLTPCLCSSTFKGSLLLLIQTQPFGGFFGFGRLLGFFLFCFGFGLGGQEFLLCSLINPKHPKQCLTHRSDQYICRMNKWLSVFHFWSLAPHPSRVYPNWEEGGGERGRKPHNIKFVNPKANTHLEPVFLIDIGSLWNSGLTGSRLAISTTFE